MCVNLNINPENTEKAIGSAVENVTSELTKEVGTTLSNVWHLVFGSFNYKIVKWRVKQQQALKDFEKSVTTKVLAIPEEKKIDPNLNIVGSALEKAKYAIEEPELRDMFANLIAATANTDKASKVLPSFSDIISQLSPLDAHNLAIFQKNASQPVASYRYSLHPTGYRVILDHVFLGNRTVMNLETQSISLSVLERQGLLEIHYSSFLRNDEVYKAFGETNFFKALKAPFIVDKESAKVRPGIKDVVFQKGYASLTPLGKCFVNICLP